jgi:hypothetical protein
MAVRTILAVVVVAVVWVGLDAVIHGYLLAPAYEATSDLWRPPGEMMGGLGMTVTVVQAACFALVYALLVRPKSVAMGLAWGALYGVAMGLGMGLGTYCYMPLPLSLAAAWFGATVLKALAAGALAALVVGKPKAEAPVAAA